MIVPPFVSCIMPTAGRPRFVPQAIRCFLAQDYPERELLIVDDGPAPVDDLVPQDPRIHYVYQELRQPVGFKRNFACEQAKGEIIAHWDDDDWSAPWRLRYQVGELLATKADMCGLERVFFYAPLENRAWVYIYPGGQRRWVYGASLCFTKAFWQAHPFREVVLQPSTGVKGVSYSCIN
jgi:glycosyltransferase involved in cell wall biosynthesis